MSKFQILPQDQFIAKAIATHGDRYDYSESIYTGGRDKIKIICSIHGPFLQKAASHLRGQNCRHCARIIIVSKQKRTLESFIAMAKAIHGDKYSYSLVKYTHGDTKVPIICHVHGKFLQSPSSHVNNKQGCPKCGRINGSIHAWSNAKTFIEKANKVHDFKYEYKDVIYEGHTKKVTITCNDHGDFKQTPENHLSGRGCPSCGKMKIGKFRLKSTDKFIEEATNKHNGRYDYSLVEYKNSTQKISIICKEHGVFQQIASDHVAGRGCQECGYIASGDSSRMSTEEFIDKAIVIYGDRFDYSKTDYVKSNHKVTITCKVHGDFYQLPADHLSGHTCPACSWTTIAISNGEQELYDYVSSMSDTKQSDRKVIKPMEIDCLIPSKKLGIEYCGIYLHSDKFKPDNYHLDKLNKSNEAGFDLLHVFEDEWNEKKDIVKSIIVNKLGLVPNKIYARKTQILDVDVKSARLFLDDNHIQGYVNAPIRIGLYHDDELVMIATFSDNRASVGKLDDGWYELVRMCVKKNTSVVGGFSKLIKQFVSAYNPSGIKTYCDKRYFNGQGYETVGFVKSHETVPSYYYVKSGARYSRYLFQKHKLSQVLKTYDPELSERENMIANSYLRIFDCGLIVYRMEITSPA